MKIRTVTLLPLFVAATLVTGIVFATTTSSSSTTQAKKKKKKKTPPKQTVVARSVKPASLAARTVSAKPAGQSTVKTLVSTRTSSTILKTSSRRRRPVYSQWDEPTYADSTVGDNVDGEDIEVRRAAVEALGPLNGSVVVTDPGTGRILALVNQNLALGAGYQPCSTVKIPVAFAALSEGIIDRNTVLRDRAKYRRASWTTAAPS